MTAPFMFLLCPSLLFCLRREGNSPGAAAHHEGAVDKYPRLWSWQRAAAVAHRGHLPWLLLLPLLTPPTPLSCCPGISSQISFLHSASCFRFCFRGTHTKRAHSKYQINYENYSRASDRSLRWHEIECSSF